MTIVDGADEEQEEDKMMMMMSMEAGNNKRMKMKMDDEDRKKKEEEEEEDALEKATMMELVDHKDMDSLTEKVDEKRMMMVRSIKYV